MTAKKTLELFLEAWKMMDFQKMYDLCQTTWKAEHTKNDLKKLLPKKIKSYSILKENVEMSGVVFVIPFKVKVLSKETKLTARILREIGPYKPSQKGSWGINPISLLKNLY